MLALFLYCVWQLLLSIEHAVEVSIQISGVLKQQPEHFIVGHDSAITQCMGANSSAMKAWHQTWPLLYKTWPHQTRQRQAPAPESNFR